MVRSACTIARTLAAGSITAMVLIGPGTPTRAAEGFAITGQVDGLYPGADMTLDARVTNPYPFPIRVMSVGATVRDAGPACPASLIEIRESHAQVDIPRNATGTVPLAVRMDSSAPDACQGATWTLIFAGTALARGASDLPSTNTIPIQDLFALGAIGILIVAAGLLTGLRRRKVGP
jgi:LPXTG-motif cell wall-anchored protein